MLIEVTLHPLEKSGCKVQGLIFLDFMREKWREGAPGTLKESVLGFRAWGFDGLCGEEGGGVRT